MAHSGRLHHQRAEPVAPVIPQAPKAFSMYSGRVQLASSKQTVFEFFTPSVMRLVGGMTFMEGSGVLEVSMKSIGGVEQSMTNIILTKGLKTDFNWFNIDSTTRVVVSATGEGNLWYNFKLGEV